jgi:hypothetical protein
MPTDHIRYDLLAQEALRGVVRHVLADIGKNGVPGDHHFYITFQTRAPGVKLSARLLAQYPDEMRIVLQHQFWDLAVTEEAFEVGLSFGGVAERLTVPFAAVTAFLDPSVQFGLQFTMVNEPDERASEAGTAAKPPPVKSSADAPGLRASPPDEPRPAPSVKEPVSAPQPAEAIRPRKTDTKSADSKTADTSDDDPPSGGAEVVRLDRFRKK